MNETDNEKTLRPNAADVEKTLRPSEARENKTLRPATADKTLRPDAAVMDKTLRLTSNADATLRAEQQKEIDTIIRQYDTEYTLNNLKYQIASVISDGTGEAQIFLVESLGKQYVLKLYYVGIEPPPNHEILEIIKQTQHSGVLVDIIGHGIWKNPRIVGEERHYEIMTYCKGSSLDKLELKGNEKRLCELAIQMASSIDFCHQHGFIHRDIKPGNYFFLDESQQQILLGDFGISVKCDKNGVCRTDQARTRIYAAPEMYYTVPGENVVEIDTKSDFYSLGMGLLCLWMGEKNFKEKEFELMKRKRTGDLPFPSDLSEHTLKLIKALTAPQPEKRCGFAEIIRWARGEDVFTELSEQESKRSFSIIFNAGKDQTAHSPEELAEFMWKDPSLAIKYLYTGKLSKWLTDNLRPELTASIEEVVEKLYPKDQTAGLYAACYRLDLDMPYYDVKGQPRTTTDEIAQSLVENFSTYQSALTNPNDALFLFFNAHDLMQLSKSSAPLFKKKGEQREALWRLIYTLNPSIPYELTDESGHTVQCNTPEEIINCAVTHTLTADSCEDLTKESFLIWLSARDKGLVAKIRAQLKGFSDEDALVYGVLYNLSPKISFYLQMDEKADDYCFTHTQIAEMVNTQLMHYKDYPEGDPTFESASYLLDQMVNITGTRLFFYLKSKGVYEDKINWIDYCFELNSKDNIEKSGPYTWVIATFKAIKGLGFNPYYYFKKSDKSIYDLESLKSIPSKEIKAEMEEGYLKEWITIFFQEDPTKNLAPKFAYEQETVKYIEFIEALNSKDVDVSNFRIATDIVNKNCRKVRFRYKTFTTLQLLLGVLCFIPILAFATTLCLYGLPFTENPLEGFSSSTILTMGILFSILIFVTSDSGNILGSAILGFIIAVVVYYGVYIALNLIMPFAHYVLAGLLVLLAVYLIQSCYLKLPTQRKAHSLLLNPSFEETGLEPLNFAFKADEGSHFESSIGDDSFTYANYLKDCIRKFSYRAVLSIIVVGFLGYLFVQYNPTFGMDAARLLQNEAKIKQMVGTWNGSFEGRNATLEITEAGADGVKAVIHVQYKNLTNEELKGTINTLTNTFHLDDVKQNGTLDGQYEGTITGEGMNAMEGSYENYKSKKQVKFSFEKAKAPVENQ